MVRTIFSVAIATLALSGCAATTYSLPAPIYSGGARATPPPPGPNIYTTAPRASVHSELFVCNRSSSNLGEVGYRNEEVIYTPYIDTPAGALLRMPAETACLSSGFGWRGGENGRQHNGVDLANRDGGWIFAAGEGRVISADYSGGYGNRVEIDHGRGVRTIYAHLAEFDPNLRPGARVEAGEAIGRMGMTGNATGVHVHYEVWVDGLLVDPMSYGRPPVYVSAPAPQPLPIPDNMLPLPDPEPEPAPDKPAY